MAEQFSNFHTHTCLCDGKDTPEELVLRALELGCPALGFSGHSYAPYDEGYCMSVAQTEEYIESLLREIQTTPPRRRPTFILKDVRLFLNSLDRSLTIMRSAGVNAGCARQDTEDEILLTIRIPKVRQAG